MNFKKIAGTSFNHFVRVFLKISFNISLNIMKKEHISVILYSLNDLNLLVSNPRQFWKLFHNRRNTET